MVVNMFFYHQYVKNYCFELNKLFVFCFIFVKYSNNERVKINAKYITDTTKNNLPYPENPEQESIINPAIGGIIPAASEATAFVIAMYAPLLILSLNLNAKTPPNTVLEP